MGERLLVNAGHREAEEGAEADGEEEASIEGVLEGRSAEGAGAAIAEGEEDSAGEGEGDGDPVVKEDVHEGERGGAEQDGGCAGVQCEERAVAVEEKGAVDEALGENGKEGIEDHDAGPGGGVSAGKGEKEMRGAEANEEREQSRCSREEGEHLRELGAEGGGIPETAEAEGGIADEGEEAPGSDGPEDGQRGNAGGEAVVERERQRDKEEDELGSEVEPGVGGKVVERERGGGADWGLRGERMRDRAVRSHKGIRRERQEKVAGNS
jgi:hypothetical protein